MHLIRNRKCHSVVLYIFNDLNPLNKNFIQTHVPDNVSICSNTVSSSPYDEEQQKGPLLPNIHLMPLVFDVLSLVPRSQQAEMLFSSFTLGKRMNLTLRCLPVIVISLQFDIFILHLLLKFKEFLLKRCGNGQDNQSENIF